MKNSGTSRSRGFGFVTFADPSKIDAVLARYLYFFSNLCQISQALIFFFVISIRCPHSLDGRTIDPKACNPRSMQKPKKSNGYPKVRLFT